MILALSMVTGLDDDRYKAGNNPENNPVNKEMEAKARITLYSVNLK
jgi:hypothetical protein